MQADDEGAAEGFSQAVGVGGDAVLYGTAYRLGGCNRKRHGGKQGDQCDQDKSVAPHHLAMVGCISGATIIAPITIAGESEISP